MVCCEVIMNDGAIAYSDKISLSVVEIARNDNDSDSDRRS